MTIRETKEAIAKVPETRVKRKPVGHRDRLTVEGKDPAYEYRFIKSDPARLRKFLDAGYEVDTTAVVDTGRVGLPSAIGSAPEVALGQGVQGILVRIRKDWYKEDQTEKQKAVDEQEGIARKSANADYGKFESKFG